MRQELLRRQIFTPTSRESPLAEHGSRGTPGRERRLQQEQRRRGLLPVRRRLQVSRAPGNGSQNGLLHTEQNHDFADSFLDVFRYSL